MEEYTVSNCLLLKSHLPFGGQKKVINGAINILFMQGSMWLNLWSAFLVTSKKQGAKGYSDQWQMLKCSTNWTPKAIALHCIIKMFPMTQVDPKKPAADHSALSSSSRKCGLTDLLWPRPVLNSWYSWRDLRCHLVSISWVQDYRHGPPHLVDVDLGMLPRTLCA